MDIYKRDLKKGVVWYLRFKENGRWRDRALHRYTGLSDPIRNQGQAELILADLRLKEFKGYFGVPTNDYKSLAIDQFYRHYLNFCEQNQTPKTIKAHGHRLRAWVDFLKARHVQTLSQINQPLFDEFIENVLREKKNSTKNRYISNVRTSLNWGVPKYLKENPIKKFPRFKEKATIKDFTFRDEDLAKLFSIEDQTLVAFFKTVYYTAGRRSEILELTKDDIDFKRRMVKFKNPKGGGPQTIEMAEKLVPVLRSIGIGDLDRLFPYSDNQMTKIFQRLMKKLELKSIRRIHDLRGAFLSKLLESGVDIETVSKIGRHKSMFTTWRYYLAIPDQKRREAINKG